MANSKCTHCESKKFELAECLPVNSKTKVMLIQCSSCGAVVGALDQYDIGLFVKEIAKKLGIPLA